MRTIESAKIFWKELKKLSGHPDHANLAELLEAALELLVIDKPLPIKNRDHPLTGPYKGFRDCHIKLNRPVKSSSVPHIETINPI
jgi:mRNA interferase YafQ